MSKRIDTTSLEKKFSLNEARVITGVWTFQSELFQVDSVNGTPGFFVPLYGVDRTQICLPEGRHTLYLIDVGENVDPLYFRMPHELSNHVVFLAVDEKGIIEYSEDSKRYKVGKKLRS